MSHCINDVTVPVQCTTSIHRPTALSTNYLSDPWRHMIFDLFLNGSLCYPQTLNAAGLPTETVRMSVVPANTPVSVPAVSVPTAPNTAPVPSSSPSQFVPSNGTVSKGRSSTPDIAGGISGGILLLIRELLYLRVHCQFHITQLLCSGHRPWYLPISLFESIHHTVYSHTSRHYPLSKSTWKYTHALTCAWHKHLHSRSLQSILLLYHLPPGFVC